VYFWVVTLLLEFYISEFLLPFAIRIVSLIYLVRVL
jgi:hypothetical protein